MKKIVLIILSALLVTMLCGCTSMTFQGTYTVETYTDEETEKQLFNRYFRTRLIC